MNKTINNGNNAITKLLLIHGYGENNEIWSKFPASKSMFDIISLNLAKILDDDKMNNMDAVVENIFKNIDINDDTKMAIVANSMGGYYAIRIAERYPHIIKKVIMISSHPFADSKEKQVMRKKEISLIEKGKSSLIASMFTADDDKDIKTLKLKMWTDWSNRALINALQIMISRDDKTEMMLNTKISYTFIVGANDPAINLHKLNELASLNNNIKLMVIDDAGHWIVHQKPQIWQAIKKMIEQ